MSHDYDLIVIGGGVAGCALSAGMASEGVRVLVLESENSFRDRVRGEAIMPWGVAELRLLGAGSGTGAGRRKPSDVLGLIPGR